MNGTRPIVMSITALGFALLLAAPAHAQDAAAAQPPPPPAQAGGQRGGNRATSLGTMPVAAIDSIVTLKPEQKTKIEEIQAAYKTDAAAARGDQAKTREVRTKVTEDIKAVLTADQNTKLTETLPAVTLLNQSKAVPITVLAAVKLTSEQWTKIKAAAKETQDKIQAIPRAERAEKRPALDAEFKTTVDPLLTAEQKAIIEKAPKATRAGAAPPPAAPAPPAPPATKNP